MMDHRTRRLLSVAATVALTLTLTSATASAEDSDGQLCVPVHAQMTAYFFSEGCNSPVGMCTAGNVTSWTGQTLGVASYTAQGVGGGAVGEASVVTPPVEAATTWTYAGDLVITTSYGELVFSDVGVFDTAGGAFTEFDRLESGTGLFEHASGTIFINGFGFSDGSGFQSDMRGTVCIPASGTNSWRIWSALDD